MWHYIAKPILYECPTLNVHNYRKFVETISASATLGTYVKILDLRNIIQSGKNSFTARLLRRCSSNLQVFIAPQTSFGYSPLISLRQCHQLRTLDLSLVSESVDLRELFLAIRSCKYLERLDFPRSSVSCMQYDNLWPPSLWYLGLAGGVSNTFIQETKFPSTISHLTLRHCPFINTESVQGMCYRLGEHLTNLKVLYPLPALRPNALDSVLRLCPNLKNLAISVEYITRHIFDNTNLPSNERQMPMPHHLRRLYLDSSGMMGQSRKIQADDITLAILDEKLPDLKFVHVNTRLSWNPEEEDVSELIEILNDRDGGVWVD